MTDNSKFNKKLQSVIGQIAKSEFMFGRQRDGLISTLISLEPQAKEIGTDSIELGKVNFHVGTLMADKMFDKEESLDRIKLALEADRKNTFLTSSNLLTANNLLAALSIELGLDEEAKMHIQSIKKHLENNSIDDEVRLGMLSQAGFYYHELGMYEDALSLNLSILEEAKELYGNQDANLLNVTRNISENLYCLKKYENSEKYKNEVIALAQHNNDSDIEVEALFKIGVLNHESGNNKKAKRYLNLSLDAAHKSGSESLINFAKSNLEELDKKIKKWWKIW